ncbi:MAG: hypothetical protein HKN76_00775 [Saprospiraceae bacterium]|nr:hypothetical protein [Saprospiraceae bacterium]
MDKNKSAANEILRSKLIMMADRNKRFAKILEEVEAGRGIDTQKITDLLKIISDQVDMT